MWTIRLNLNSFVSIWIILIKFEPFYSMWTILIQFGLLTLQFPVDRLADDWPSGRPRKNRVQNDQYWRHRATLYVIVQCRLVLVAPLNCWQNSTPFFGAVAFCTMKIDDFRTLFITNNDKLKNDDDVENAMLTGCCFFLE